MGQSFIFVTEESPKTRHSKPRTVNCYDDVLSTYNENTLSNFKFQGLTTKISRYTAIISDFNYSEHRCMRRGIGNGNGSRDHFNVGSMHGKNGTMLAFAPF